MKTQPKTNRLLQRISLCAILALSNLAAPAADPASTPPLADADGNFSGTVLETINADRYTYVLVDTGTQQAWAAATHLAVTKGDKVTVYGGMAMANFHSKTLNRDFELVYFTGSIVLQGAAANAVDAPPALPPGHPALPSPATPALPPNHPALTNQPEAPAAVPLTGIKRAAGGRTVQEIIAAGAKLAGQTVTVRAKVVKYNAKVMGKNWLHLQDGSGNAEKSDNDLTITTTLAAKVGDIVLVTGKVATNKDFGSGYKYAVLVEEAQVTVE